MRTTRKRSTSTAKPLTIRPGGRGPAAGFTLVESMVVLGVFSILVLTFFKSISMVQDGNVMMEHHNRVNTRCQYTLNRLVRLVSSSVRLYGENTEGQALLDILKGVKAEILPDSKLPILLPDGIMEKDPLVSRSTGNCLLLLKADRPYGYMAEGGTEEFIRIDVYRVLAIYLKRKATTNEALSTRPDGLDLAVYRSAPLLDRSQVDAIQSEEEKERLLKMARMERNIHLLFDTRESILEALTTFDPEGVIQETPPYPYIIPGDPISGRKDRFADLPISVATNGAPVQFGVARFSQRVTEGTGFPHGFEARVIGGAGSRQILLHLTMVMRCNPKGEQTYADLTSMAVAKDF